MSNSIEFTGVPGSVLIGYLTRQSAGCWVWKMLNTQTDDSHQINTPFMYVNSINSQERLFLARVTLSVKNRRWNRAAGWLHTFHISLWLKSFFFCRCVFSISNSNSPLTQIYWCFWRDSCSFIIFQHAFLFSFRFFFRFFSRFFFRFFCRFSLFSFIRSL